MAFVMFMPETICKIEDMSPLNKFNAHNININMTKHNSNKKFCGKHYDKPIITNETYNNIDDNLKEELKHFCEKYGYNNISHKKNK